MSKRLPVPADLEHLIEKRDEETDRRKTDRRRRASPSPNANLQSGKPERRQTTRRRKTRRKAQ